MRKQIKAERSQIQTITVKGLALIAAVESGLLPEIERNGEVGYDSELFNRFWDMFMESMKQRDNQLNKQRQARAKEDQKNLEENR